MGSETASEMAIFRDFQKFFLNFFLIFMHKNALENGIDIDFENSVVASSRYQTVVCTAEGKLKI